MTTMVINVPNNKKNYLAHKFSVGMWGVPMKHLTLNEGIFGCWIRVGMGCVLDVVRVEALGGSLGWAHSQVSLLNVDNSYSLCFLIIFIPLIKNND